MTMSLPVPELKVAAPSPVVTVKSWPALAESMKTRLPIPEEPVVLGPLFIPPIPLAGAGVSLLFLAAFSWFFLRSRRGIAMRAVADNQQVAMAMGINVERYFGLAWAMTGIVSALGGIVWGNLLGVDVQLSLVGLKVFPVVILGGLDSIPGAIVGGLIVGLVENMAAGYIDPYVGGGTKDFAPYVLMIVALMVRPYGIFGKAIIERI
jgi:branched-chain amino acid transport system permease protein